jgi:hypothetical protein
MNIDVASPLGQVLSDWPWHLHANPEVHAFEQSLPIVNKKLPAHRGGAQDFCVRGCGSADSPLSELLIF